MLHRPGRADAEPMLSDGTPVSSLIDREKREIDLRVLNDREVYELELERLWSRAWVLVGHESEIPEVGDYVTRQVGEDRVIAVRQRDGSIACLLNVCPHRAMQVCRASAGNATVFKCVYHGWTFSHDGAFRGAPFNDEMYPEGFDREARALLRARVELFGGLIFVNWSDDAPSLDDYLGEVASYLRLIFDRTERGFEVLGAPQRYIINANWKTAAEQAAGDGYHGVTLHRSLVDMGVFGEMGSDARSWGQYCVKVSANGHGFKFHDVRRQYSGQHLAGEAKTTLEKLRLAPPAGMPAEMVEDFVARFSEEELSTYVGMRPGVGEVFPNVHVIAFYAPDPAGGVAGSFGIHTFTPKGPDQFEFAHWNFIERGASEAFREKLLRVSTFNAGASGVIEQDDSDVWPAQQKSARGVIARRLTLKYHATTPPSRPEGWVGGGTIYDGFNADDNQWNWWTLYFDYLLGKAGAAA